MRRSRCLVCAIVIANGKEGARLPDIEAIEVLIQAKERLFEHGWGVGSWAFRETTDDGGGGTGSLCLEEAIAGRHCWLNFATEPAMHRAGAYVSEAVEFPSCYWTPDGNVSLHELYEWNDSRARSVGEVMDALDRAIEIAKERDDPALTH